MKQTHSLCIARRGFTLVELLVVIAIVAGLAGLAFTMAPKMLRRGEATKSMQNLRQIGILMATYASENNNALPAPKIDVVQPDGSIVTTLWFQRILQQVYPDVTVAQMTMQWWKINNPFLRNPLCKATSVPPFSNLNPGYAFNRQIILNLQTPPGGIGLDATTEIISMPLSRITEPSRTPLVAPRGSLTFSYSVGERADLALQKFLTDNQMPILFVDGHVEKIPLREYGTRNLEDYPRP